MHLRKINLHKFLLSIFIINTTLFGNIFNEDSWSMVEKNKDGAYFKLDFDHLKQILNGAPQTSKGIPSNNILVVPTHTGEKILFKFYKNSVMHPNLAERYSDINSYVGVGVDNPSFRATIVINNEIIIGSISIDSGVSHYKSFGLREDDNVLLIYNENRDSLDLGCRIIYTLDESSWDARDFPDCLGTDDPCNPAGIELVTYRFAAMITESVNNSDADGTVEGGLTWLVGSVAYVNALYIRDVTFQLQLVEQNDELIFTDSNPAPDVFNQDCGGPWETLGCELGKVDSVLDARVGPGGWDAVDDLRVWDYGALFDNGYPGGLAYCPGPTSAQVPDMWVFSHEVMHNFGSPHNYSGEGGIRTSIGGTIMAHRLNDTFNMFSTHSTEYALNYQETTGPYGNWWYHNGYSEEITNNTIPDLILPEGGFTIPSETPYVLEGYSVPMYDDYTYNWESNDDADEPYSPDPNSTELPFLLPDQGSLSTPVTPSQNGYRRIFPEMEVLLENEYEKFGIDVYTEVNQIVEKLPFATREMNMRLVVRTNDPYAGTLNHKNLEFFVDGTAGPFRVTSQADSTIWEVGSEQTIVWDIANTDDPNGVNCQSVDIILSILGDENFDFLLGDGIPNSGTYSFTVPSIPPSSTARLMVKATDNIFFDMNNGSITIINNNTPSMSLTEHIVSILEFESYVGSEYVLDVGFDDGVLPMNWSTATNAECDNPGWFISDDASSSYFQIPPGDGNYIATNDDVCNSDGSNDMLFTGPIEIPNGNVVLSFSRFFTAGFSQSFHVLLTNNAWADTTELLVLGYWDGNDSTWINESISLSQYSGEVVEIAFHSNDNGNWASGVAIDNINLSFAPGWISTNSSGFVGYMETEQIDVSINTDGLELGIYEPFIVVNSITTADRDTVNVILEIEDVNNPPTVFNLISPVDSTEIVITANDIDQEIELEILWESSTDSDSDGVSYRFILCNGNYDASSTILIDTLVIDTLLNIPYQNLVEVAEMLEQTTVNGQWTVFSTDNIDTTMASDVRDIVIDISNALSINENLIPEQYALHQNYPNPFNPTTILRYDLPEDIQVRIMIYDIMGREVRTLMNVNQTAGYHSISWDAKNDIGEGVSAGMYIYMIQAGEFRRTKKMILLK